MTPEILVTDSLFILQEHEQLLRDAGYAVVRLDTPTATEAELCEAVVGKVGYLLGGVEHVTPAVIAAGTELRAIVFTGADWRHYVPGHPEAASRGIAIANCPAANAVAVAEYAVTLMLAMTRSVFDLGRTGSTSFATTASLPELSVGLVGMGAIAERVARSLLGLGVGGLAYASRTRKPYLEEELGLRWLSLPELFEQSDLVSLHASKEAGAGYVGGDLLGRMRAGALLVDTSFTDAVDRDALYDALSRGAIRAALDQTVDERFSALPLGSLFASAHTAYNTASANRLASDMATASMINLLESGEDRHRVV